MAETFGLDNPYKFGCDSSLEFPPHKSHSELINDSVDDLHKNYTGNVYKYESVVKNELAAQPPDYLRFRGVMPGWDNTPRRGFGGNVFYGSAPVLYEQWLRGIIAFTRRHHAPSNRIIFINAWNEWGEGAHLEPDRLFGSQYLQATRRAVTGLSDWRTILANARANSADCIDSLNELEALLNSYDASLKFLGDKNLAYEEALPRQKFVPIGRSVQGALEVKLEGSGNIDRINQFEKITDLTLGQHDFLHIIGWVYISGQEVSPFTEGFITLLSADHNKDHFTVRISHRIERPDVVKYVQAPEGEGLWSGVHGSSLVGEIPTGSYTVAIDTKIDKYCYRYMSNKRVHIV